MTAYTSATEADRRAMLDAIGVGSLEDLFADIPEGVRPGRARDLPPGMAEPGTAIEVDVRGKLRRAEVRQKPLYPET